MAKPNHCRDRLKAPLVEGVPPVDNTLAQVDSNLRKIKKQIGIRERCCLTLWGRCDPLRSNATRWEKAFYQHALDRTNTEGYHRNDLIPILFEGLKQGLLDPLSYDSIQNSESLMVFRHGQSLVTHPALYVFLGECLGETSQHQGNHPIQFEFITLFRRYCLAGHLSRETRSTDEPISRPPAHSTLAESFALHVARILIQSLANLGLLVKGSSTTRRLSDPGERDALMMALDYVKDSQYGIPVDQKLNLIENVKGMMPPLSVGPTGDSMRPIYQKLEEIRNTITTDHGYQA